jgi:hypothetical protein
MYSALTGVRVLVTRTPERAHWLVHFCWGLHIVTEEKGKAIEISYSDARSLVTFSRGFILWQHGTCFYVWLWYKRERTPKHSAIWFILGGYAPSYKSDSLVFRCSFYYLSSGISSFKAQKERSTKKNVWALSFTFMPKLFENISRNDIDLWKCKQSFWNLRGNGNLSLLFIPWVFYLLVSWMNCNT